MKVKHVLQVSLLLGLCIWLLFYQMPRLNDGESSSRQGIKSSQKLNANGIKLGRKDLKPKIETQEEIEDEKQNEGQAEENKPQEEKSDHGKTSVDGIKKETKHLDEEEGRGDKDKDDEVRDESSVEENGKHHKLERAESNAKNDTEKSNENKTEETTQGNEINVKPSKENATKEKKQQLESEGDGLTNYSSSTEKVSLGGKKANVMKQKEFDENSKSNDTAASPVEARSSEQDSASYHNSSPRTAPADDQKQDMELSPSSTTQKHNSVDSSTSTEAPMEAGANTK